MPAQVKKLSFYNSNSSATLEGHTLNLVLSYMEVEKRRSDVCNYEETNVEGGYDCNNISPYKLAVMMKHVKDKSSEEYQREKWEELGQRIRGLVDGVDASNIRDVFHELCAVNLRRGRGLFCHAIIDQPPDRGPVLAALVAAVNCKFPEIGHLLVKRIMLLISRFLYLRRKQDQPLLLAAVRLMAHLLNEEVVHEFVAYRLLGFLLMDRDQTWLDLIQQQLLDLEVVFGPLRVLPWPMKSSPPNGVVNDFVEVAVVFLTEFGSKLNQRSPQLLQRVVHILDQIRDGPTIGKRVRSLIQRFFALRDANFEGHPAIRPELNVLQRSLTSTHDVLFLPTMDPEHGLDTFENDPNFSKREKIYKESIKEYASCDEDLVDLRSIIHSMITSSVGFEEAGHKLLMKIKLDRTQEMELCKALLDLCAMERTYLHYYGLLGQWLCMIDDEYQKNFEKCFIEQYPTIHQLEADAQRNLANFFAHLLGTDALHVHILSGVQKTDDNSSSHIFLKTLFKKLSQHMGMLALIERLSDTAVQLSLEHHDDDDES